MSASRKIARRLRRQTLKSIDAVLSDPKDLTKEEIATLRALRSSSTKRSQFGGPSLVKDPSGEVRRIEPEGNPLRAVFVVFVIFVLSGVLWWIFKQ